MAPYAVHVTYTIPWQGLDEETSNVFHYEVAGFSMEEANWVAMADAVVAAMRPVLSTRQNVKRVRIHGPTNGTKADDKMVLVKDYTGTGAHIWGGEIYSEAAVVVSAFMGRGPNGGKQYLRKFIHCYALPSSGAGSGPTYGRAKLVAADKQPFINLMDGLKNLNANATTYPLCNPTGKNLPLGTSFTVKDYIVTRQFRRRGKRRATNQATV